MSDLVLSVGIISVDGAKYAQRRAEQRQTWVGIGHRDSRVFARFVLRCGTWRMSEAYPESNYTVSASILQENATFGDVVCTDVPENAGRLKGPSLIMLAWLRHALSQRSLRSRFIAVVDDDAYIQLADMLKLIQGLPRKSVSPLSYFGAIHGWSINHTAFHFRHFGWDGWPGCGPDCGPFPFATGSFIGMSRALARQVVDAAQPEEESVVRALPPNHPMFFHDSFLGQAIYRLVQPGRGDTPKIDVYNFDPWSLDTDGFRVGSRLLLWHNRHKQICRVACLGEYYVDKNRHCGTGTGDFEWRNYSQGAIDPTRYTMWYPKFQNERVVPTKASSLEPGQGVLAGEAAKGNATCQSLVDLRHPTTIAALDLKKCKACFDQVLLAKQS